MHQDLSNDGYSAPVSDSALDLSVLPDYNNHPSAVYQFPPHLIMLPTSALTMPNTDNVPFYISPTGQLILANLIVERLNEGLVFKQVPLETIPPVQSTESLAPEPLVSEEEGSETSTSVQSDQKLLSQRVNKLIQKLSQDAPDPEEDLIAGGYNLSSLVVLAGRLKQYRVSRALSQAKLSKRIVATTTGELKFSQSFLCRFEKLGVTLRAALGAQPYLQQWLDQAESVDHEAPSTRQENLSSSVAFSSTSTVALLDLRERALDSVEVDSITGEAAEVGNAVEGSAEGLPRRRIRKCRVVFSEEAVAKMIEHFKRNPWPRGEELSQLSEALGYERESVRVWFSNRRYQQGMTAKHP